MYRTGAVAGGLLAGALGAAAWAWVAHAFEMEHGLIAWAIGGLVGFGVALGNRGRGTVGTGLLAVTIAAMSIVAGKYIAVRMVANESAIVEMVSASLEDEEYVISFLADGVVEERASAGESDLWPPGVDPEMAAERADYLPDVWAEATARWDALDEAQRSAFRSEIESQVLSNVQASMPEVRALLVQEGFLGSFGLLDLVFFGLAMATAFKTGSSTSGGEDAEEAAGDENPAAAPPPGPISPS